MLTFTSYWVFLLLPLPLLIHFLLPTEKNQQSQALRFPFFAAMSNLQATLSTKFFSLRKLIAIIIWALLVTAAANPLWLGEPMAIPQTGRDLMLAIDLSGSMELPDMELHGQAVNRLDAIKSIAGEFINQREGDRLGLILFGSRAYLRAPLTHDRKTINDMLQDASISLAGPQTAIGDAIGLAIKHLDNQQQQSRVLVLLTDGANNSGHVSPIEAAKLAAKHHIKIYTIGLGSDSLTIPGVFGSHTINPSSSLDEKTLETIANTTGGHYFRARDSHSLKQIYQMINKIEPVSVDEIIFRPQSPLYQWPLGLALFLSFILTLNRIQWLPKTKGEA